MGFLDQSQSISEAKPMQSQITFDTQLKIALMKTGHVSNPGLLNTFVII